MLWFYKFKWVNVFVSPAQLRRSGAAGSPGDSARPSEELPGVFRSSRTMLVSHRQGMRVPVSPHP